MPDALTVTRHDERPTVAFPGGATYQPIIGDDTGAGLPIRTGIQTSPPGYQIALHSHPYARGADRARGPWRGLARRIRQADGRGSALPVRLARDPQY